MEFGFVNFKGREYNPEVIKNRNDKIAELMEISIDDLDQYDIIELNPYTLMILDNYLDIDISNLRFYSMDELENESLYFFKHNNIKFGIANGVLPINNHEYVKENSLNEYLRTIQKFRKEFLKHMLKIHADITFEKGKLLGVSHPMESQILLIAPKNNILARKEFEKLSDEKYDEIQELCKKNDLITIRHL